MANVLSIVFGVVGLVVMYAAILVWAAMMLPVIVERARQRVERSPLACTIWGTLFCCAGGSVLVLLLPFRATGFDWFSGWIEFFSTNLSWPRFANDSRIATHVFGWLLVTPLMAAWVIGGAALVRVFQTRAMAQLDLGKANALGFGALCLGCACLLPFVGWFLVFPLITALSVGAGLLALLAPRNHSEPAPTKDLLS